MRFRFGAALIGLLSLGYPGSVCAGEKINIAVITLKNASGISQGEAEIISDRLRAELFNTGRVNVMERDQMQEILKEQGFQASGVCTDEACLVEMGQLLGVKRLITGSIGKLGKMFLVNLRAVDVQTGRISKAVSRDITGGIEEVVVYLKGIAGELVGETKTVATKDPLPAITEEPEPEPEPEITYDDEQEAEDVDEDENEAPLDKNANRTGLRIAFTLFPGEYRRWNHDELNDEWVEQDYDLKQYYEDTLANWGYDVNYNAPPFMRLGVNFMIKAGQWVSIDVGPTVLLGYKTLSFKYDGTGSYDERDWMLVFFTAGLHVGPNFVWRLYPLKINLGIEGEFGYTLVVHSNDYTYDNYAEPSKNESYYDSNVDNVFAFAFGPRAGVEILAGPHVGFNVDFHYRFQKFESTVFDVSDYDDYSGKWQFQFPGLGIGAGVNFYFGG